MNKIKISNEQERIKIEFDFDNIQVAREYFQDEECIKDIADALDYENEIDEDEKSKQVNELAEILKGFMENSPRLFNDALAKAIKDNEPVLLDVVVDSEEALPMLPPGAGINEMIGEYKLEKDVI
jgi:tRNA U34 5-methylaminomethyl-2-thiouridine-forming methyltransferase MnmC